MEKFVAYMTALGRDEGIEFNFREGEVAGTGEAHRVLWVLQEEYSPEHALKGLESLYRSYFEQAQHPSTPPTLLSACHAAGLNEEEARSIVDDQERGKKGVERELQQVRADAVDSVPYVVFEGRRRDFTEVGAKGVGEYGKVLGMVEKEAT